MHLGLKTKFLVPVLALIVLGMTCQSWLNSSLFEDAIETMFGQDMSLLAEAISRDVGSEVRSKLALTTYIARRSFAREALQSRDLDVANAELAALMTAGDGLNTLNLYDVTGLLIVSTTIGTVGRVSIADRPYFQAIRDGKREVVVSNPIISRTTGNTVVILAHAVRDPEGRLLGVVVASLELSYLTDKVNKTKIGRTGYAIIVDDEGRYVAHPDSQLLMSLELPDTELGRRMLSVTQNAVITGQTDGGRLLVAVSREATTGWAFIVVAPYTDMLSIVDMAGFNTALVAAATALTLMLVVFMIVSGGILRPLERCAAFARKVASGDLSGTLDVSSRDQVGNLAADLRGMVNNLRTTIEAVRESSKRAEAEVLERRKAEVELRKAHSELIHAGRMAALGQMAASIAHELNQPITAMKMFCANSQRLLQAGKIQAVEENLGHISGLVERLGAIASQLKTFSRKSDDLTQRVHLRQRMDNALNLMRFQFETVGCTVSVVNAVSDVIVRGDPIQVDQVLVNLLQNALDAVRESSVKHIDLSLSVYGETALIRVDDSGPGVPSGVMDKLFEPFFTTKKSGEGLGLGLAIVQKIVHSMGGTITAENLAPCGARFKVRLPLASDER